MDDILERDNYQPDEEYGDDFEPVENNEEYPNTNNKYHETNPNPQHQQNQQQPHAQKLQNSSQNAQKDGHMAQDRQSKIKQTINSLTKNIIFSKQSIVKDITSINHYHQVNDQIIRDQLGATHLKASRSTEAKVKVKGDLRSKEKETEKEKEKEKGNKVKRQANRNTRQYLEQRIQQLKAQQTQKHLQRQRNHQIFEQKKQARKQQHEQKRNESKVKKSQLVKRIQYEQKFISRRQLGPDLPISQHEMQVFEDELIKKIKQRLNIGKTKDRERERNRNYRSNDHNRNNSNPIKKSPPNPKLQKKILLSLKKQLNQQQQPPHQSIIADHRQLEDLEQSRERKKSYRSAPHLRLPDIYMGDAGSRTYYQRGDGHADGEMEGKKSRVF